MLILKFFHPVIVLSNQMKVASNINFKFQLFHHFTRSIDRFLKLAVQQTAVLEKSDVWKTVLPLLMFATQVFPHFRQ